MGPPRRGGRGTARLANGTYQTGALRIIREDQIADLMAQEAKCSKCGAQLAGRSSQGLCALCLFETVLSPSEESSHLKAEGPGTVIARYRLIKKIGEGGFGAVYVAEQNEPVQRRVALKVLKLGMDTRQVIARFEAERQALAMMTHPNIARVLDAGATDTGRPFFVMELVEGRKLTEYCRLNALSLAQRLELFTQVCHAVQHAHQKGVIHRDLKPSNILVAEQEGVAVPKVIDFGIAKAIEETEDEGLTSLNQFLGTPAYMSPEQVVFGGRDIDTRSDIYSLGVVLYELVAGQPPFDPKELARAGIDEMRRIIREVDPPRPSTTITRNLNPARLPSVRPPSREGLAAVRGDLDWVVMKCLEKDRARRYATANGLAADIRRHLDHEPVIARSPTGFYRLQKLVRRHRLAFSTAGITAAVLIAGSVVSTYEALRARHAEREQGRLKTLAEAKAVESRNRLVRRYVAEGNRWMELNRPAAALPWMVEALALETGDSQREGDERLRIAQALEGAPELRLQISQGKSIDSVALSSDGNWLATGSDDGQVWISDVARECSSITNLLLPGTVGRVSFSHDGSRLIAMDRGGRTRVWNVANGEPLTGLLQADDFDEQFIRSRAGPLKPAASFSPDGKLVLTAWGSKSAELREAVGGALVHKFAHGKIVYHAAFSPNGQQVVTSSEDGTACVWDVVTGARVGAPLEHSGRVVWAQFSSDGNQLLTVRDRHVVQLWNWREGRRLAPEIPRRSELYHASLSPDGTKVLTTAWSGYGHLYDAASGRLMQQFLQEGGLVDAAFSPDGRRVATACEDGNAWLWDTTDAGNHPLMLPQGNHIEGIAFSGDGRLLAAAGRGGEARVWDLSPAARAVRRLPGNTVEWVEFDPAGHRVFALSTGRRRDLAVYSAQTGDLISTASLKTRLRKAHFSPDGNRILAFGSGPDVFVFETTTGREFCAALNHGDRVRDALWSPDGKRILTAAGSAGAWVWDATNGKPIYNLPGSNAVLAIAVSPDGSRFATAQANQTVQIRDINSCRPLGGSLTAAGAIEEIRFSPDGRLIALASADGSGGIVEIHDATSGKLIGTPLTHRDHVGSFEFSPDGKWVATACEDHLARVWDAVSGEPVSPWLPHAYEVREVAFSPDGRRLATLERRGTARLWNATTGEPISQPIQYHRNAGEGWCSFSPDGRTLLLCRGGDETWLRELRPEPDAVEQLRVLAQVLSCTRFDPAAGMVPLDEQGIVKAWQELRAQQIASVMTKGER